MNTIEILNKEFSTQDFTDDHPAAEALERYKDIARNYAQMENAVAVLSDLRTHTSYIYYGRFAHMLGTDKCGCEDRVSSIWEKEIFRLVHPDDLANKHAQELCFFHFIKRQPKKKRTDYYLASRLRMKNNTGSYTPVLHRMFYIPTACNDSLWLALCLYSPLLFDAPHSCLIVNSANGQTMEVDKQNNERILSVREKQVLSLIDKGLTSKRIAEMLSISINTVNRHRQEILHRLQVKNAIEACRTAKSLRII